MANANIPSAAASCDHFPLVRKEASGFDTLGRKTSSNFDRRSADRFGKMGNWLSVNTARNSLQFDRILAILEVLRANTTRRSSKTTSNVSRACVE